MREIHVNQVETALAQMITDAASHLPQEYLKRLEQAAESEVSPLGRTCLRALLENARYSQETGIPTCQDTGMAIVSLEIGQEIHFTGGDLGDAVTNGVRQAYAGLRKSVVGDPLMRINTGDNTPPILHYTIVPGSQLKVTLLMKGFGAELMSALRMMPASAGWKAVRQFVLETVEKAGPNACPPIIVGVGLGSSFDGVALLAKQALMRPLGDPNPQPHLAAYEQELLEAINASGIGPQGLGGRCTALAVHIESFPTHIAALPVAVNLNRSAPRRAERVL